VDPFQRCCRFRDVVKGTGRDDDVEASLVGAPCRHVALVVGEPARPVGRAPLGELDRGRVGVDGGDVVASPGRWENRTVADGAMPILFDQAARCATG
jgi:hypothetical protein